MDKISVLMSVYKNSDPNEMRECMDSLLNQTLKADEYVCVCDGPIGESLTAVLKEYADSIDNFVIVPLEKNVGLGLALCEGMKHCSYPLIARMDTDDVAASDRFEKEAACFENDKDLSIVGSNIAEFIGTKDNVVSVRDVPLSHDEIVEYMKKRCPFNHMTVMFRASEVIKAGGYLDWHYDEDSYLWVRMYLAKAKFLNIGENLVYARINEKTFSRRGGYAYYKSERDLFRFMRDNGIISGFSYLVAVAIRFAVQVLMPNKIREFVFLKLMRKKAK